MEVLECIGITDDGLFKMEDYHGSVSYYHTNALRVLLKSGYVLKGIRLTNTGFKLDPDSLKTPKPNKKEVLRVHDLIREAEDRGFISDNTNLIIVGRPLSDYDNQTGDITSILKSRILKGLMLPNPKLVGIFNFEDFYIVDYNNSIHICSMNKYIGYTKYRNMNKLISRSINSLTLIDLETSSLREANLFVGLDVNNLNIDRLDLSRVESLEQMFKCAKIHGDFKFSLKNHNIFSIEEMFAAAEIDGELDLSGFDVYDITSMERAFVCLKCKKLDISTWRTDKAYDMDDFLYKSDIDTVLASTLSTESTFYRDGYRDLITLAKINKLDLSNCSSATVHDIKAYSSNYRVNNIISKYA